MTDLFFLLIGDALDVLFNSLFPMDLSKTSDIVVFHFTLIALILISRKKDKIDSFLLALIIGSFIGNRLNGFIFEIGLIYLIVVFIIRLCFKHYDESFIEAFIMILLAILIKEVMLYGLMIFYQRTRMTLSNWLLRRCIPTLFGNIIPIVLMLMLNHCKDVFLYKREMLRRKEENLFFKSVQMRIKKK